MATPVIEIDIADALSGKTDGDAVSNTDLGVTTLADAYASALSDGTFGLRSETAADDGSPSGLDIALEAAAAAEARTGRFYAIRFTLTPVYQSTVATDAANIWWRPNAGSSAAPWVVLNLDNEGASIATNRRTDAASELQLATSPSFQSAAHLKYGEAYDVVLVLSDSASTSTERFVGCYVNGVAVSFGYDMASNLTFNGSYAAGLQFPYTAGMYWLLTGYIRVYSADSLDGIVEQSGGDRFVLPLPAVLAADEYGLTRTEHTGETETYRSLSAASGVQNGCSWLSLAGTSSSGVDGVNQTRFEPADVPAFSSDGFVSVTLEEFGACADGAHEVFLYDADDVEVAAVRVDDRGDAAVVEWRVQGGSWVELATGVDEAAVYWARVTVESSGAVSLLVRDKTSAPTTTGGMWGGQLSALQPGCPVAALSVRTRTSGSSGSMVVGAVRWQERPTLWFGMDSWGSATSASTPVTIQPNHMAVECHGAYYGHRSSGAGRLVSPGGIAFRVEGGGGGASPGISIEEWAGATSSLWSYVRGHVVLLCGSLMNTASENDADINGTASARQAVIDATVEFFRPFVVGVLGGKNRVLFIKPVPPPTSPSGSSVWTDNAVTNQFVIDAGDALEKLLRSMEVPAGSALAVARTYEQLVDDSAYAGLTWDSQDLHLASGSDRTALDAALASAALIGTRVGGGASPLVGGGGLRRAGG